MAHPLSLFRFLETSEKQVHQSALTNPASHFGKETGTSMMAGSCSENSPKN